MEWVEFSHPAHTGMTQFSSVQSLSHAQLFVTPWTAACLSPPSNAESVHFSAPNIFMPGWLATVKENPSKFPGEK